ncbi:hypothetical membrane protein [Francisella tularensis subsp. tularensis FSC198]|uniref:Uncharacterized protein n=2 Tax=Francisella tularensis subsp. tularensis (strain SCHU S4 / Schu 4) TaxID=177416 RepID=A0AAD3G7R8_FRATT|nr:hypothetical protein FT4114_08805 [Francisella tularensis subsp. tularensis WY-00W4114]AKU73882.1 hypothetical protein ACX55_719 [Francisella tularensis subsp. tularensis]APS91642.1 hypothetical protein AV531_02015 [Francisella tularensis]EKM84940.1 hypothetical protein B344_09017 [Francisella tularensis subsp. tularensis 831]EKM85107.1 hypothetical protein B345_09080 [Francisella tularensis subsp. tularensis AS_713]EKM89567.1 hypothetical protein B343_01579 [Francisella tularensis subsp. t
MYENIINPTPVKNILIALCTALAMPLSFLNPCIHIDSINGAIIPHRKAVPMPNIIMVKVFVYNLNNNINAIK